MNFGNHLKDTIQSEKNIINIDGMTLRVWVTQLQTVVFGHGINSENNPRKIIYQMLLTSSLPPLTLSISKIGNDANIETNAYAPSAHSQSVAP